MFHATGFRVADLPDTLTGNCGNNPGIACRLAWDVTHSPTATQVVKVYLAGPVSQAGRIAFVLVLALLVRFIFHRLINKVTERAATATLAVSPNGRANKAAATIQMAGTERREQRARALGSILRSAISVIVFGIAALTILSILGFNVAPLLASTAVLGVALGFGAQNLVRDYLAGLLMLVEDHYGVGDTINAGVATGTVEAMSLLTTTLRDVNGVVWHIRNGTIDSVGNESQGWSRAVIDYPVPYEELPGPLRGGPGQDPGTDGAGRGEPVPRARLEEADTGETRGVGGSGAVRPGSDDAAGGQDRPDAAAGGGPRAARAGEIHAGRRRRPAGRPGHHRDFRAARDRAAERWHTPGRDALTPAPPPGTVWVTDHVGSAAAVSFLA